MNRTQVTKPSPALGTLAVGAIPILVLALVLAYIFEIPIGSERQFHSTVVGLEPDGGLSPVAVAATVAVATGETVNIVLPDHSTVEIGDEIVVLKQGRLLRGAAYEFCHFPDKSLAEHSPADE